MRRDERVAVEMPGQFGFTYLLREYDLISSGDNVIGGYPVALVRKAGDVDLADYKTVFLKRAVFGKQSPVFRDYMVVREHHILRRFRRCRVAVYISAGKTRGGRGDKQPPVALFSNHLIRGGGVADYVRTGSGEPFARRAGNPQILAYFDPEAVIPKCLVPEYDPVSERNVLTAELHGADIVSEKLSGRELARLVKFSVARNICFRNQPEDPSAVYDRRAVEQLSEVTERKPQNRYRISPGSVGADLLKRGFNRIKKRIGKEQISAGVPGQAQLRKDKKVYTAPVRFGYPFGYASGI